MWSIGSSKPSRIGCRHVFSPKESRVQKQEKEEHSRIINVHVFPSLVSNCSCMICAVISKNVLIHSGSQFQIGYYYMSTSYSHLFLAG